MERDPADRGLKPGVYAGTEQRRGNLMENLIGFAVLAAIGWWLYKRGKGVGSRKGFGVRRCHCRRNRRR